jgi:hypothetical protein
VLNINELRNVLSEQIELLRDDKSTPAKANAITNACGKILSSIKLELEYRKATGKIKECKFLDYKE